MIETAKKMRFFAVIIVFACSVGVSLSGCSGLLPDLAGKPPALYEIAGLKSAALPETMRAEFAALPDISAQQMLVDLPLASAGIDTPRVALVRADGSMGYYRDVSWTDRAPAMLQTAMIEAIEATGKLPALGRDNVGLRADYLLKTELGAFEARYTADGMPVVQVRLRAKLIVMPARRIVGSQNFTAEVPSARDDMQMIFTAYQQASDNILKDMAYWVVKAVASAEQPVRKINKK